jgi:hypothetical protein
MTLFSRSLFVPFSHFISYVVLAPSHSLAWFMKFHSLLSTSAVTALSVPCSARADPEYLLSKNRNRIPFPMPTFDLVVVGSGGGPFETNLSSFVPCHFVLVGHTWFLPITRRYLFKPCDVPWTDGIIALEAGEQNYLYVDAVCTLLTIVRCDIGSGIGTLYHLINRNAALFDGLSAHQVYSLIQLVPSSLLFLACMQPGHVPFLPSSFLISHAHLDHVAGLILSAGSLHGCRKRVCAPPSALKTLETIFSDRIWPNLASWDEDDAPFKLLYRPYVLSPS